MATKDIIETYTSPHGEMADYIIECEDRGVSNPTVLIRLVPKKREALLEGQGVLQNHKIANRSGKVAREVFDWAEGVIIERRRAQSSAAISATKTTSGNP
jgi:hypothetical protein